VTTGVISQALLFASVALCVPGLWLMLAPAQAGAPLSRRLEALSGGARIVTSAQHTVVKEHLLSNLPRLDALLSGVPGTMALAKALAGAGMRTRVAGMFAIMGCAALVTFALAVTAGVSATAALVLAAGAAAVPLLHVRFRRHKRVARFTEQLPDALDLMVRTLKAGNAFAGGLRIVGEEMGGPLGAEFMLVYEEMRLGREPTDSMEGLRERMDTPDVRLLCTSLLIQRETGGNLVELLQNLSTLVRRRLTFAIRISALTAEGRLSALVLSLLPPAMLGLLFLLNRPYARLLFQPGLLRWVLFASAILQVIGALWVRRIVSVRY
jgi:tight adherence protein B